MKFWLVRHAAPLVEDGICYGALDVAADPAATDAAAAALSLVLPPGIELHSSPLRRCAQLTQCLVALRPGTVVRHDARLAEMDFGTWEGQSWEAIGKPALDAWTADFTRYRPGSGESVADFMTRVAAAFDEALGEGRDVAWITHAGVIRACGLLARGIREVADATQWPAGAPAFGAWSMLEM